MPEFMSVELAFVSLIVLECALVDAFERRRWPRRTDGEDN